MRGAGAAGFDWRDATAYAPLLEADRALFAWEWLRRDPDYVAAAQSSGGPDDGSGRAARPEDFGLIAFEAPALAVPEARPLWAVTAHPLVLAAEPDGRCGPDDTFDLQSLRGLARLVARDGREHLLLSDGLRAIRLDAPPGTFSAGRVCLRYRLFGLASAELPLLTLRRLIALCATGGFARSLHRPEARARRWVLMLRTSDALAQGASQRQIAESLFSRSTSEPCWRIREGSVRSQVQRLVRSARAMAARGYRKLLLG
jgi:hypothetical protein